MKNWIFYSNHKKFNAWYIKHLGKQFNFYSSIVQNMCCFLHQNSLCWSWRNLQQLYAVCMQLTRKYPSLNIPTEEEPFSLESFKLHFATDNFNDIWRKRIQIYWLQGKEFNMYYTLARQGIKERKKAWKRCVYKQRKCSIGMPNTFFSSALTRLPSCLQCKPKLGASWYIQCARINVIFMSTWLRTIQTWILK
jgi:hypothetical protein